MVDPYSDRNAKRRDLSREQRVYIIRHPHQFFKIGVSNNPRKRLKSLQTGTPYELSIEGVYSCPRPRAVEQAFHEAYADDRVRGEWFDLSPGDVAEIHELLGYEWPTLKEFVQSPDERRDNMLKLQALIG